MGTDEALFFFGVGQGVDVLESSGAVSNTAGAVLRIGLHGMVGGIFSVAGGGKNFGAGFLAAGFAATADMIDGGPVADLVIHAVAGGTGSLIGGGKFENGAVTGAFGYLFNELLEPSARTTCAGAAAGGAGVCAVAGGAAAACPETGVTCVAVPDALMACGAAVTAGVAVCSVANGSGNGGTSARVHGNSYQSMRPNEVYYLINKTTEAIDKIGCTCDPGGRYSQAYLNAEGVRYETQTQYQSRYPAMVDENIRLTWYYIDNGRLPRLNQNFR